MFRHPLFFIFLCVFGFAESQEILNTDFYSLQLPANTAFKKVNETKEDLANIDVFNFVNEKTDRTKYLIYLMSNKMEVDVSSISDREIEDYLFDIQPKSINQVNSFTKEGRKWHKVKVSFEDGIIGSIYLTIVNDVLHRLFFMIPNESFYTNHISEIEAIMVTVKLLKSNWLS